MIREAFGAESRRLSEVVTGLDDAAFTRPTPCDPWTVADLLYHVQMTMGRLPSMLAAPEPAGAGLVTAAGYYRGDHRFSAGTNAERIRSAQRGAAGLARAAARARDFDEARQRAWVALRAAPPGRVVLRATVTACCSRSSSAPGSWNSPCTAWTWPPAWTAALDDLSAADVTEDLLLPAAAAARLRAATGWDQVTLIAGLTGRLLLTPAETGLAQAAGIGWLALG